MLQLMKALQRSAGERERLSQDQVWSGIRRYSAEYFVPEMSNELAGYVDELQVGNAIRLLTSLRVPNPFVGGHRSAMRRIGLRWLECARAPRRTV